MRASFDPHRRFPSASRRSSLVAIPLED